MNDFFDNYLLNVFNKRNHFAIFLSIFMLLFVLFLLTLWFFLQNIEKNKIIEIQYIDSKKNRYSTLLSNESAYADAENQKTSQYEKFKKSNMTKIVPATYLEEQISILQKKLSIPTIQIHLTNLETLHTTPCIQSISYELAVSGISETTLLDFMTRIQKEIPGVVIINYVELEEKQNEPLEFQHHRHSLMSKNKNTRKIIMQNTPQEKNLNTKIKNKIKRCFNLSLRWCFRPQHHNMGQTAP